MNGNIRALVPMFLAYAAASDTTSPVQSVLRLRGTKRSDLKRHNDPAAVSDIRAEREARKAANYRKRYNLPNPGDQAR